jgi:hypothetical protein
VELRLKRSGDLCLQRDFQLLVRVRGLDAGTVPNSATWTIIIVPKLGRDHGLAA